MPIDLRLLRALDRQITERRRRILRLRASSTPEARQLEEHLTAEMDRLLEERKALTD